MWLAVGYLGFIAVVAVIVFVKLHEERRAYLVSPVGPMVEEDRAPLSPLPLRLVLVVVGLLVLFDAAFLTFLLPPVLLSLVEDESRRGPGASVHLLNAVFDLLVLKSVWSCWRRSRFWLTAGIVLSALGILLLLLLQSGGGLPRWYRGRYLGSISMEVLAGVALFALWLALAAWTLTRAGAGASGTIVREEDLASGSEPLTEAERVRVRWARGEMTSAERDAVLASLKPEPQSES